METKRVEALSDAVIAIAITLLVLDLRDPGSSGGGLARGLAHQWPSFAAYAVSFATIGIIWVNLDAVLKHIQRLDRPLVFLNLALMMVVSFIPYPTGLLAAHIRSGGTDSRVAAAVYGITMSLMGAVFSAIWWRVGANEHLLAETATPAAARARFRRSAAGPFIYLAAAAVSAVSAPAALVAYAALAVYFALPGRRSAPAEG